MNTRMADQYAAAIRDAKAGRPVAVADLPSLPDMPPLPPQRPSSVPAGPAPGSECSIVFFYFASHRSASSSAPTSSSRAIGCVWTAWKVEERHPA